MADVTLSYKGSDILELSDSGSATLKTGGTYCDADIELEYVKPSGGGKVYELHTIENIVLASATQPGTFLHRYIDECAEWCYFPTEETTSVYTIARGYCFSQRSNTYTSVNYLGSTTNAITSSVPQPAQYQVNDSTYNSTRQRGNVNVIPSGTYTLKFYGVAL